MTRVEKAGGVNTAVYQSTLSPANVFDKFKNTDAFILKEFGAFILKNTGCASDQVKV